MKFQRKDFQFSVEVGKKRYDVYRYEHKGEVGQVAVRRLPDGKWEVGLIRKGTKSLTEVLHELQVAQSRFIN